MKNLKFLAIAVLTSTMVFSSCSKEGCTNQNATNYDEKAKKDDGSCEVVNVSANAEPTAVQINFVESIDGVYKYRINNNSQTEVVSSCGIASLSSEEFNFVDTYELSIYEFTSTTGNVLVYKGTFEFSDENSVNISPLSSSPNTVSVTFNLTTCVNTNNLDMRSFSISL